MQSIASVIAILLLVSACQTTAIYTSDTLKRPDDNVRILVLPIDVNVTELSFAGVPTPRADWSQAASKHLTTALNAFMAKRTAQTVEYKNADGDPRIDPEDLQLTKLFGAVSAAIGLHRYVPTYVLPHKGETFDWTLGPSVKQLKERFDADYALFIKVDDSYASGDRAAAIAVAAILFGVAIQGGIQKGQAALVDLNSGEIAWFNRIYREAGDIRTEEPAHETISVLLNEFPK